MNQRKRHAGYVVDTRRSVWYEGKVRLWNTYPRFKQVPKYSHDVRMSAKECRTALRKVKAGERLSRKLRKEKRLVLLVRCRLLLQGKRETADKERAREEREEGRKGLLHSLASSRHMRMIWSISSA